MYQMIVHIFLQSLDTALHPEIDGSTVINNNEQSQEKSSNPAYFYSCATMDIFQKVGHIVAHNPLKSDIVKVWGRGFQRVRSFAKGISALEGDGEGAGG